MVAGAALKIKGFFFPKLVTDGGAPTDNTPKDNRLLDWGTGQQSGNSRTDAETEAAMKAADDIKSAATILGSPAAGSAAPGLAPPIPLPPKLPTSAKANLPEKNVPELPRGTPAISGFAPLPEMGGAPLFQVFVLGTRGAGKTVFLASLYKLLSTLDISGNNFRLICRDMKSLKQLNETYRRMANLKQGWPPGSFSIQEYIFDCVHSRMGQDIDLFKFRYFDFPGGFVSDTQTPEELQFVVTQIKAAHSVLILLDGKKIKDAIEGASTSPDEPSLYEDLDMLMDIIQDCVGKPMHFAITKADLLSPKRHPLSLIRDTLMKHNGFKNIIRQQQDSRPVHLLPVSAIGKNFAKYDAASQQMKKLPNGRIEPSYVDLSLTFTIIDYLTIVATDLGKELPEVSDDTLIRSWFLKKAMAALPYSAAAAGPIISVGSHFLHLAALTNPVFQVLISGASLLGARALIKAGSNRVHESIGEFRDRIEAEHKSIKDRHSAADAVLKIQMMMAERFKRRFPDSSFNNSVEGISR